MIESNKNKNFIEKVIVKFDNTKPIQVIDFLNAIQGFQNQYRKIIKQENRKYTDEDVKLYIHVREGCIEWEFIRHWCQQQVFDFGADKLLQKTWEKITECFKKISNEEVLEEDIEDLLNAQKCLQPSKNDLSSKLTIKYKNEKEETELSYEIIGASGRGVYDKIGELIGKIKSPKKEDFENAILKLTLNEKNVIKCKIEDIDEREIAIICSAELRQRLIIESEKNPFSTYYVVNGKIRMVEGKIIAYEIIEIVDVIVSE